MTSRFVPYLYLLLAMLGAGSTVIVSKLVSASVPPFTATALRFAMALPLFLLLLKVTGVRWLRPSRQDCCLLLLQAGAGSVGYTVLLMAGTRLTSVANASVMMGMLPAVSSMLAVLLFAERLTRRQGIAVGLSVIGALIVSLHPEVSIVAGDASAWVGNLLILLAVSCEGVFIMLNRRLSQPLPPLLLSTCLCGLGLLLALPMAVLEWDGAWQWQADVMAAMIYYAVIPTVLCFVLWYAGAARVSAGEAALFSAVLPVSALLFAAIFLHEPIFLYQLVGVLCVLGALLWQSWPGIRANRTRAY